jgi:hypothetical protein
MCVRRAVAAPSLAIIFLTAGRGTFGSLRGPGLGRPDIADSGGLCLRGGVGARPRGWQAVKDTADEAAPVLGGLNEDMPDMMLHGPHAQVDFIYDQENYERIRDRTRGGKRRVSGLYEADSDQRRGRALFHNEIWDAGSLGTDKHKLFLRASEEDEDVLGSILPGTKAYAMCVRLWSACRFGLEEEIVPALLAGANVHMRDEDCTRWDSEEGPVPYDKDVLHGCSALHWAAFSDEPECIDTLVQCGADVDYTSDADLTALDIAAALGNTRACVALIRSGASADHLDEFGLSPADHALLNGHLETADALYGAMRAAADIALEEELLDYGRQVPNCSSSHTLQ